MEAERRATSNASSCPGPGAKRADSLAAAPRRPYRAHARTPANANPGSAVEAHTPCVRRSLSPAQPPAEHHLGAAKELTAAHLLQHRSVLRGHPPTRAHRQSACHPQQRPVPPCLRPPPRPDYSVLDGMCRRGAARLRCDLVPILATHHAQQTRGIRKAARTAIHSACHPQQRPVPPCLRPPPRPDYSVLDGMCRGGAARRPSDAPPRTHEAVLLQVQTALPPWPPRPGAGTVRTHVLL